MISLQPTSSYSKFYKQLSKQLNLKVNQHIKSGISETEFILQVDLISSIVTRRDIQPVCLLLQSCRFKQISLVGGSVETSNSKLNKSTVHIGPRRNFSATPEFIDLFKFCCKTVGRSLELINFSVKDLRLSTEAVQFLAQGISTASSLKELTLKNCSLNTQQFALIVNPIAQNSTLIALDFSRNFLTDGCGVLLQRILEEHRTRRDRLEWVYKSRGETPEEDIALSGICEVNLSYNRLELLFVKDLIYFLKNDRWLRSLNLRGNFIDEQGIQLLNEVLDSNNSLISLDIRDNHGCNRKLSGAIYSKLVRNMKNVKEQNSLLANVSAIPKQQGSQSVSGSYQQDQESPMISFGDKILEQNITKYNSNSSKKDFVGKKHTQFQKQEMIDEEVEDNDNPLDDQCPQCEKQTKFKFYNSQKRYQAQFIKAKQMINLLQRENQHLRALLGQNQEKKHYSFQQHSTSNVLNNIWQNDQQGLQNHSQQVQGDQDDMIHKIEFMMSELTRMMDSLENQNSATHNNLTAGLSSTLIGQNNNTHVIYQRDHLNENPFILDAHNLSEQQQQEDEQDQTLQ